MTEPVTIAIDAMGGDSGASVIVHAAKLVYERKHDLRLILVGDEATLIEELLKVSLTPSDRLL
ncbi:MAG: phosphate acyltransferase, partial [Gammaproteobacteria bacterium]|nr:phosphate acyltransferase [Gammaproteobacteria bacterium]